MSFQSVNEISSIGQPITPQGSLCNTFNFDSTNGDQNKSKQDEPKRPPKIWISKSASMDDDLDDA